MELQNKNVFKDNLILEVNKLHPNIEDKNLENQILKISKEYLVNSSKNIKQVDKNDVFKFCNLDFEINLVNSKILPASNHLIGHIIVGGLRRPGINPAARPHPNDLWRCSFGVAVEKDSKFVDLLTYGLETHLNEDTFNEACQKAGVNLKREEVEERLLANAIFYNYGLKLINEFN